MNNQISEAIMELLEVELPSWFPRSVAIEKLHGLMNARTLANLDAQGKGPPQHRMGRTACYTKDSFLRWVRNYYGAQHVNYDRLGRRIRETAE